MKRKALVVVALTMAIAGSTLLPGCGGARVMRYKQGGLEIIGGNMSFNNAGSVHFSGLQITSETTPIARFRFQQGIDRSNPPDGELTSPPDVILTTIDNSNPSMNVSVAEASIWVGAGEHALTHAEVYAGAGTTPVWSSTWSSGKQHV